MIENHACFDQPPADAILWRYMDFAKFVDLVERRRLYFAALHKMEDNFEGRYCRPAVEHMRDTDSRTSVSGRMVLGTTTSMLGGAHNTAKKMEAQARRLVCVSCWHWNQHESSAMWKLYLSAGEGVAIRTTFGRVVDSFADFPGVVYAGRVQYIDYAHDPMPFNNLLAPAVYKRKSFEHEHEVRLAWVSPHGDNGYDGPPVGEAGFNLSGFGLPVNTDALIEQVFVAPTAPRWLVDLVGRVSRTYGGNWPVVQSDLYQDPLW